MSGLIIRIGSVLVVAALAACSPKLGAGAAQAKDKSAPAGAASSAAASAAAAKAAQAEADLTNPVLKWSRSTKKDALTDQVTTKVWADTTLPDMDDQVEANASCGDNGVSFFFEIEDLQSMDGQGGPVYSWYEDQNLQGDENDQVADVRMRIDGGDVHVAKGYPEQNGHTYYSNSIGILFYDPGLQERSAEQQEDSANTGIPALDALVAPMVHQAASANAEEGVASSAGPIGTLLSAHSVRIELPIANYGDDLPVIDLNPQDGVLHKLVADCNARLTGEGGP